MSEGRLTQFVESVYPIPFVVTTTYEVWMRIEGQEWRPWSGGFVEHHHAQVDAANLAENGVRAGLMPRKVKVVRRTETLEWIGDPNAD